MFLNRFFFSRSWVCACAGCVLAVRAVGPSPLFAVGRIHPLNERNWEKTSLKISSRAHLKSTYPALALKTGDTERHWVFGLRVCFHRLVSFSFQSKSISWLLFAFANTFPPSCYYGLFFIWKSQSIFCNLTIQSCQRNPGSARASEWWIMALISSAGWLPNLISVHFLKVCVCVFICVLVAVGMAVCLCVRVH